METVFKATAYHKWLMAKSSGDRQVLAFLIWNDLTGQNPQTFDLMEHIGEEVFNVDSAFNAADYLIENVE